MAWMRRFVKGHEKTQYKYDNALGLKKEVTSHSSTIKTDATAIGTMSQENMNIPEAPEAVSYPITMANMLIGQPIFRYSVQTGPSLLSELNPIIKPIIPAGPHAIIGPIIPHNSKPIIGPMIPTKSGHIIGPVAPFELKRDPYVSSPTVTYAAAQPNSSELPPFLPHALMLSKATPLTNQSVCLGNKSVPKYDAEAAKNTLKNSSEQSARTEQAKNKEKKKKPYLRCAGGEVWEDRTMAEWDPEDYRLFCGDLGNEVSDELLANAFRKYPSFLKARVIRNAKTNKSKGYGFVSFKNQSDFIRAFREMDGKFVGCKPIKLKKSDWKTRNLDVVKKKKEEMKKLGIS